MKKLFIVISIISVIIIFSIYVITENYTKNVMSEKNSIDSSKNPLTFFDLYQITKNNSGYWGGVFDSQFIYLIPFDTKESLLQHDKGISPSILNTLRYDTTKEFQSPNSWEIFSQITDLNGKSLGGYDGGVFDGHYVYFIPHHVGTFHHGEVLRYNITKEFQSPNSWEMFDLMSNEKFQVGGFSGGVFDGHYVYFIPHHDGTQYHSNVVRYDTTREFQSPNSWETFNMIKHDITKVGGFSGAAFDGMYIYLSPYNGEKIVRYDTTREFQSPNSWETYENLELKRFRDIVFDGHHIQLIPFGGHYSSTEKMYLLLYDTTKKFQSPNSWKSMDVSKSQVVGFRGGVLDNHHTYLIPNSDSKILRIDLQS